MFALALLIAQLNALSTPAGTTSPVATPAVLPAASPTDVVVNNSGATNMRGYTVVIHPDGSADVLQAGKLTHAIVPHPQIAWLYAKLGDDAPLGETIAGRCMRSASFGTTTRVSYHGETSGDLGCGGGPAVTELKRTIGVIVAQLGIATTPMRRFAPL